MSNPQDAIDRFAFFRELRAESRERLRHGLTHKAVSPGTNILRPGDVVDGVYLVGSGAIRVYYIDPEGREGTLYWIERGESCILALNSLFTEIAYPAWADAEDGGADVYSISGALFRELFAGEPSIQRFLFAQLSERVFGLLQLLEKSMRLPQEERLILLLLARADSDGVVHLSQDKLARHLGTIREVVSRLLRNLATQRLIAVVPRRVTILDRDRLMRMVAVEGA
jgi:CRP/FNR family transcriptional regulator